VRSGPPSQSGGVTRARNVLVTGASTGIGYATAVALDARGWTVFAGVRSDADEAVIRLALSSRSEPVRLDVTSETAIASAVGRIAAATDGRLQGLVNNAGIAAIAPFETLGAQAWRDVFNVNVFGTVDVTRAMLPLLRAGRGRVVTIGSIASRVPWPMQTAYAASKAALATTSDLLGAELRPFGIRVSLVEPGAVRSAMAAKRSVPLRRDGELEPALATTYRTLGSLAERAAGWFAGRSPAPRATVARVVHALESSRPRARYVVGFDARVQTVGRRLVPASIREALLAFAIGRVVAATRVTAGEDAGSGSP